MKKWFMIFGLTFFGLITAVNVVSLFPILNNLLMVSPGPKGDSIPLDIITLCKTENLSDCTTSPLACFGKIEEYAMLSNMTHGYVYYATPNGENVVQVTPHYQDNERKIIFNEKTKKYEDFHIKSLTLKMHAIAPEY